MGYEQKMWETKDKPVSRCLSGLVGDLHPPERAPKDDSRKSPIWVLLISEGEQADGGGRGQLRWNSGSWSWSFISQVY